MTDFEKALAQLKNELYSEPIVQEYFSLKEKIDSDKIIQQLNKDIKIHQRLMCENQNNDEIYFKEKEIYESFQKSLSENPLWSNYLNVKEEVYLLLVDIKNIIS